LKEVQTNVAIAANTFPAGDTFKVAAAATAATDAPYQWVLRRMFLGRLLDSDKVYYPENGGSSSSNWPRTCSTCRAVGPTT